MWVFRTFWPKRGFWGQNRGRGGAILTPNELVLTFGGSYFCANFGENRSRNATVRVLADGQIQTHPHTDANRFYNLSHAICHSYGTGNNDRVDDDDDDNDEKANSTASRLEAARVTSNSRLLWLYAIYRAVHQFHCNQNKKSTARQSCLVGVLYDISQQKIC